MQTQYETLLVTVDGPIVEVLLNRPAMRNAISFQMVRDLNSVLAEAKYDASVRVVTVCGEGKVFSVGHDLADVKSVAQAREQGVPHPEVDPLLPEVPMRSWYFPKPLIAGVHGFVGPEALKTIATFDFVLAARGTRFSYEQARVRPSAPSGNPLVFLLPMRVRCRSYRAGRVIRWPLPDDVRGAGGPGPAQPGLGGAGGGRDGRVGGERRRGVGRRLQRVRSAPRLGGQPKSGRRAPQGLYECGPEQWVAISGVPAASLTDPRHADSHPQLTSWGYFEPVEHAILGRQQVPRWSGCGPTASSAPSRWHPNPSFDCEES